MTFLDHFDILLTSFSEQMIKPNMFANFWLVATLKQTNLKSYSWQNTTKMFWWWEKYCKKDQWLYQIVGHMLTKRAKYEYFAFTIELWFLLQKGTWTSAKSRIVNLCNWQDKSMSNYFEYSSLLPCFHTYVQLTTSDVWTKPFVLLSNYFLHCVI